MIKSVYKLDCDCGRAGSLSGVFLATKEEVDLLIESKIEVYFGEVLGKHSEVYGAMSANDITLITDNIEVVKIIEQYGLTNGYNPFDYTAINVDDKYQDQTVAEIITDMLTEKAK